jgi:hypothetical protein
MTAGAKSARWRQTKERKAEMEERFERQQKQVTSIVEQQTWKLGQHIED